MCNEFLGSGKVDAVQSEMGGGTVVVLDSVTSVEDLMSGMVRSARNWKPDGGTIYSLPKHPCDFLVEDNGGNGILRSSVNWSLLSLEDVRGKVNSSAEDWRNVGEDVFVEVKERGVGLSVIIPCGVQGARKDQISEIPLEVEVSITNVPDFDKNLLDEMAAHLTRKLIEGLKCENDPKVPSLS
ncbi:hypothetical protein [Streptomyces ipomoeae]|uniref:hypothetical protein n=1 Tax=Streptomyces ipomoeae TaxID=103232 RepID=UPI0011472C67|nr:hypothetical protein [Streptomyces ipomoeae]MDX2933174.1 hypothetical protein [Streptomyces ipomoeae]TQE19835.1 hypothetical protein SipoB123_30775 [Streptomyces ipomoeae]